MNKNRQVLILINLPLYLKKLRKREIKGTITYKSYSMPSGSIIIKYRLRFDKGGYDRELFSTLSFDTAYRLKKEIKQTTWWALASTNELYPFHLRKHFDPQPILRPLKEVSLKKSRFPLKVPFKVFSLKEIILFWTPELITPFKYSHRPLKR